jgi:hypothetical protein
MTRYNTAWGREDLAIKDRASRCLPFPGGKRRVAYTDRGGGGYIPWGATEVVRE